MVSNQEVTAFEASFLRFGNLKAQKLMKKLKINVLEKTSQKKIQEIITFYTKTSGSKEVTRGELWPNNIPIKSGHSRSACKSDP